MKGNMIGLGGQQGGELLRTVTASTETSNTTARTLATLTCTIPTSQFNKYYCLLAIIENNITEGYYYNYNFYQDSAHMTPITGQIERVYRDLATQTSYYYDNTQNKFLARVTSTSSTTRYYFKNGLSYVYCSQPLCIMCNNVYYTVTRTSTGNLYYRNNDTTSSNLTDYGVFIKSCSFTTSSNNTIISVEIDNRSASSSNYDGYGTHTIKLYGIQLK